MPQIHIVSGFLGSGKTSFLKNLLYHSERPSGVALIENEFGKVALDKAVLEQDASQLESEKAFSMYEIAKGCVCCSVQEDLENTLYLLLQTQVYQHIFIEPTGVALPSEIKKHILNFRQKQKEARQGAKKGFLGLWKKFSPYYRRLADLPDVELGYTFHLLDAENYLLHSQNLKSFFDAQTASADFIFVNRFETLSQATQEKIAQDLERLQVKAQKIWVQHIQEANLEKIWRLLKTDKPLLGTDSKALSLKPSPQKFKKKISSSNVNPLAFSFDTETLFFKPIPKKLFEDFLRHLKETVDQGLLRVKGFVHIEEEADVFYHLEYTPSTLVYEPYLKKNQTLKPHLIFIGQGVDFEKFFKVFQDYRLEEKEE